MEPSILIAGYGTMTGAMVEGWLRAGLAPDRLTACGPNPKTVPEGMRFVTGVPDGEFDIVLLGVKPQKLAEAAPALEPLVGPRTVLVSVLAGVELASLAARFPRAGAIVRLMPNLAAALGKSPIGLVATGLTQAQRGQIDALATMLGEAEWLADESQFDLVAALAGSGPAFVYRFIDALAAGAERLGLDPAQAQRLEVIAFDPRLVRQNDRGRSHAVRGRILRSMPRARHGPDPPLPAARMASAPGGSAPG